MKARVCSKDGHNLQGKKKLIPAPKESMEWKTKETEDCKNPNMSNFILTMSATMNNAVEEYIKTRKLDYDYIKRRCKTTQDSIIVPLYSISWVTGGQERYIDPDKHDGVKSKTVVWSRWIFFLNGWDREKDILIVEWEIDFLSIIIHARNYNIMWLKWVSNLPHAIREIEKLQKIYDVYILVDNDEPANESIKRIPYTELHLYDVREALSGCKDVNDSIIQWKLNLDILPRRIVKLKPQPKKQFTRSDTINTIEKINSISAIDVLESLFPEYRRHWNESIREWWKETHGYKYSRSLNIVSDFSWKGRPSWTTYMIAKAKFGDAHLTFLYFQWKI